MSNEKITASNLTSKEKDKKKGPPLVNNKTRAYIFDIGFCTGQCLPYLGVFYSRMIKFLIQKTRRNKVAMIEGAHVKG